MLEQITPGDAREAIALSHNVVQLRAESAGLRNECGEVSSLLRNGLEQKQVLEAQTADLVARMSVLERSRSWNLTRPLRSIARQVRGARR
jgi:hypothetical protein